MLLIWQAWAGLLTLTVFRDDVIVAKDISYWYAPPPPPLNDPPQSPQISTLFESGLEI